MSMASARSIQPVSAGGASREVVAARHHRDAGAGRRGGIEHTVGERAAGVARDHDVGRMDRERVEPAAGELHPRHSRPLCRQGLMQRQRRRRRTRVDDDCVRGGAVEQQHREGQQPVSAGHVDDAAAAESDGGRVAPSPRPRRAPCAAGSRRRKPRGPVNRTAHHRRSDPGRERSGGSWTTGRTRTRRS